MPDCSVCGAAAEVAFTDQDGVDHLRCTDGDCGAGGFDAGTHRGGEVFEGASTGRRAGRALAEAKRRRRRA